MIAKHIQSTQIFKTCVIGVFILLREHLPEHLHIRPKWQDLEQLKISVFKTKALVRKLLQSAFATNGPNNHE